MSRKEKLLREFSSNVQNQFLTPVEYLEKFVDFLVERIEQLENPSKQVEIEVKKKGEDNGQSAENT